MPTKLSRFFAVLLLVIPGWMATYGFLLMKDALFVSFALGTFPWLKFIGGLILFFIGVAFIGGWIFYRDRKRNYVAPRFRENKKQPRKP